MRNQNLQSRTLAFAIAVIRFVEALPKSRTTDVIGRQLLRCGTSVGANYRSACRARSNADFISKMGIVEEETDETIYWLDLLVETGVITNAIVEPLRTEANELLSMTIASIKTARGGTR